MSAPESTAVITPPTPPAPAPATAEHDSALHQRLNEIESWLADKFHELLHLLEKAAPVVETAAAAAVPVVSAAAAPVVSVVEKVSELLGCCPHIDRQHNADGSCAACPCKGPAK